MPDKDSMKEIYEALKLDEDNLCGMANVTKSKSSLDVDVWSEHSGVTRNISHKNTPRAKLSNNTYTISVSIEENPKILRKPKKLSMDNAKRIFSSGIKYIQDNYEIFLMHYNDRDDSFDDESLFNALREKGVYK